MAADSGSSPSSLTDKCKKITSSFFSSQRLFTSFTSKVWYETEAMMMMSPTSILDSKPFFSALKKNPFWSQSQSQTTPASDHKQRCWDKLDSKGLVDALLDDDKPSGGIITSSNSQGRMVLFGSQLKIQIPPLPHEETHSPSESPEYAADFEIKVRNSRLGKSAFRSADSAIETCNSSRVFTRCLSVSEMELSEDYTRVISRGPNPRTTHIFDDCIVDVGCSDDSAMENVILRPHPDQIRYPSESFMKSCFYCKKDLGHGVDIYIYRGDRAFCSSECRYEGMLLEERMTNVQVKDFMGHSFEFLSPNPDGYL